MRTCEDCGYSWDEESYGLICPNCEEAEKESTWIFSD